MTEKVDMNLKTKARYLMTLNPTGCAKGVPAETVTDMVQVASVLFLIAKIAEVYGIDLDKLNPDGSDLHIIMTKLKEITRDDQKTTDRPSE